jgi:hypothetical protein
MKFFTVHKEFKRISEEVNKLIEKCDFKLNKYGEISENENQDVIYQLSRLTELLPRCIDANLPDDAAAVFIQITILDSIDTSNVMLDKDCIERSLYRIKMQLINAQTRKESIAYNHILKEFHKVILNN